MRGRARLGLASACRHLQLATWSRLSRITSLRFCTTDLFLLPAPPPSSRKPNRGEFLCPLCKRLSNIVVPHLIPTPHLSALVHGVLIEPSAGVSAGLISAPRTPHAASRPDAMPAQAALPIPPAAPHMALRAALAPFLPDGDVRRQWPGFTLPFLPHPAAVSAGAPAPAELAGCGMAAPGGTAAAKVAMDSDGLASTAAHVPFGGVGGGLRTLAGRLDRLRIAAEAESVAARLAEAAPGTAAGAGEEGVDAGLCAHATSFLSPDARDLLAALVGGSTWLCQATEAALQLAAPAGAAVEAEQPPSAPAPTSETGAAAAAFPASSRATAASPTRRGGDGRIAALAPLVGSFHAAGALCRAVRARLPPSPASPTCAHDGGPDGDAGSPAAVAHPCCAVRRALGALQWALSDAAAGLPPWLDGCGIDPPTLRWLLELVPSTAAAAAGAARLADGRVLAACLPWESRARSAPADRHVALPPADPHAAAKSAAEFLEGVGRDGWARPGWAAALPTAWGGQPPLTPSHRRWLSHAMCNLQRLSAPPPPAGCVINADLPAGGLLGPGAQIVSAAASGVAEGGADMVDESAQISAEIAAEIAAVGAASAGDANATFQSSSAEGYGAMTEALWRTIAYTVLAEAEAEAEAEAPPHDVTAPTAAAECAPGAPGVSAPSSSHSPAAPPASRLAQLRPLVRAARLSPFLFPRPEDATAFAAAPLARLLTEGDGTPGGTQWAAGERRAAGGGVAPDGGVDGGALFAILAGGAGAPGPGQHQLRLSIAEIRRVPAPTLLSDSLPPPPPLAPASAGGDATSGAVPVGASFSPAVRRYELTLTDGSDRAIGRLAPHLGWLIETSRLRPGCRLLLRDWLVDGPTLLLMDVAPLGELPAAGQGGASGRGADHTGLMMRRSGAFAAPLLLAPPHLLLTSALLCAADVPQSVSIVQALAISVLSRTMLLSARGGTAVGFAPCEATQLGGWEVWTVLPLRTCAHRPSAMGCGWPVHTAPAPDAPVLCWLSPGNSVRACPDPEAGAGWMRVRLGHAPHHGSDAASPTSLAAGPGDAPGEGGGWTRAAWDSPMDCMLVSDRDAREPAAAEDAAAAVRLRSALGILPNPDAPSATALSRLLDVELLAFHRMARALMRTLLPTAADADSVLPPLAPGRGSYTDVLRAVGAPTPGAVLGCPRLLRTMRKWVSVSRASLNAAHDALSAAPAAGALPAPWRPLAGPAAGAAPPPPASLLLLSAAGPSHLWQLPERYTDIFSSSALRAHRCPATGKPPAEPAICLVCGAVLCAGTACCKREGVGALTRHACAECSEGAGVFLLVHKCQVILLRGGHAAYWSSPFVDEFGEEDSGLRRGRPLRLDLARVASLQRLQAGHAIAAEVVRERSTRDRVIRDNYW